MPKCRQSNRIKFKQKSSILNTLQRLSTSTWRHVLLFQRNRSFTWISAKKTMKVVVQKVQLVAVEFCVWRRLNWCPRKPFDPNFFHFLFFHKRNLTFEFGYMSFTRGNKWNASSKQSKQLKEKVELKMKQIKNRLINASLTKNRTSGRF